MRITFSIFIICAVTGCSSLQPISHTDYEQSVRTFIRASSKEDGIFPWKRKSEAVDRIVKLGKDVSPYLVSSMQDYQDYIDGKAFDFMVQQNITIALCRIHGIRLAYGKNIYSVRSFHEDNLKVYKFWRSLVVSPEPSHEVDSAP